MVVYDIDISFSFSLPVSDDMIFAMIYFFQTFQYHELIRMINNVKKQL